MKIVAIFVLLTPFIIGISVGMDVLLGLSMHRALNNLLNPFWVTSGPEMLLVMILMLFWLAKTLFSKWNKKKSG